ncbi:SDR family oxidoreductase [Haloplasma contractile]|uniref:1-deoxy-D-xylulose-5-phosphate reductoisomerase protein n=1 Tax=Haloplasma contractile SSD-17B TaxID=1033810 RepID=U2E8H5_9MOLU|nr:SDR family oxidoreductase [Haloplasma contractile]ERJ11196.1 1-deoxy-D-xylulose-5-phosphate reductoisomerase protein [Haloplasma contractile SSD-17B]
MANNQQQNQNNNGSKQTGYPDSNFFINIPKQHQTTHPGLETDMNPKPIFDHPLYNKQSGRLQDKVAIITGGDSGIGRAVSLAYAKDGAKVVIVYYNEDQDANDTKAAIEQAGSQCHLIKGDISDENFCNTVIQETVTTFGGLNILVNNSAVQFPKNSLTEITSEQLNRTFAVNIFSMFYLSKAALPHLSAGDSIINTSSITAYQGHETLLDYSATKGAITTFTRSLSKSLAPKAIRVNSVAPGPIWTPLIPSSFDPQKTSQFGSSTPLGRPGQPVELGAAYVFLASDDASYITGQTIHINGGEVING